MMLSHWLGPELIIVAVVLWSFLLVAAVAVTARLVRKRDEGRSDTPLEIAMRRFARGEITRRELDELRGLLSKPPTKGRHFAG